MSTEDVIGVVREHRWIPATSQERRLRNCRAVLSLGGGKYSAPATRQELVRLVRPGTRVRLVHAFLLAEPSARNRKGGMMADLEAIWERLTEGCGGTIEDLELGTDTSTPTRRMGLLAAAKAQLGKSLQGAKSAANGKRTKGRQLVEFTKEQEAEAKRIWRDTVEYPHEFEDAAPALAKIVNDKGEKFTTYRARNLWKARKSKR